jgi:hypothetical protein
MTETTNSPTKPNEPNEPACTECSRLASRVEELREYLDWKVGHASKRIHEVDGLGNHHIPLDSQLNGYLQGERDMANDALKKLHELGLAGAHAEEKE